MDGTAITQEPREGPEPVLDERELRIMMAAAAYHARRVARTMRLDIADREDAEQEILVALLDRRRFFDAARGAWSSFADRVARQAVQAIADGIGAERRVRGPSLDQPAGAEENAPTLASVMEASLASHPDQDDDVILTLSVERFVAELPDELRLVARLGLDEDGDLAEAQRRSGLSTSEFYRRLREVRFRMLSLDLVRLRGPAADKAPGDLSGKTIPPPATE